MNNASQNRILFLYKWLNEETDCDHPLTSKEILKRWDQLGFSTDRRSVYKDIETLQCFGVKVVSCRGTYNSYFLEEKQFSLAELKIIIDALESCQILPAPETKRLVEKLSFFAAPWEQEELLRPIFVDKAYKNTNITKVALLACSMTNLIAKHSGAKSVSKVAGFMQNCMALYAIGDTVCSEWTGLQISNC